MRKVATTIGAAATLALVLGGCVNGRPQQGENSHWSEPDVGADEPMQAKYGTDPQGRDGRDAVDSLVPPSQDSPIQTKYGVPPQRRDDTELSQIRRDAPANRNAEGQGRAAGTAERTEDETVLGTR